jgi:hypothetical protein
MRHVIIEDTLYKITEFDYKKLEAKKKEIESKEYYNGQDMDMMEFIETLEPKWKKLGSIDFDFRL